MSRDQIRSDEMRTDQIEELSWGADELGAGELGTRIETNRPHSYACEGRIEYNSARGPWGVAKASKP